MTRCPKHGKRRYRSEADARAGMSGTKKRGDGRTPARRVYQCPDCHGWHLTSKP